MSKKLFLAFAVSGLFFVASSLLQAQRKDVKDVLRDVAKAMGADEVKSLQYSATGFYFWMGQGYRNTDPWPKFTLRNYTRMLDYDNNAYEEKLAWTESPADFANQQRGGGLTPLKGEGMRQDNFLAGNYSWNLGANGNVATQSAGITEERQVRLAITPDGWIKAATNSNSTITRKKVDGKPMTVISFTLNGKYKVNGYIDDENMLDKVETWISQPILGNMHVEVAYSDYKDFSGFKLPTKIVQKEGGYPVLDLMVTNVIPNATVNISVPDVARTAPSPARVVTQPLADHVWILRSGTQSLAVEFKDYVTIIDGAGDEQRSQGVYAETKKMVPDKPVRYVINTHHHLDHSGGLRTFVARGATIITAEENKPYFEKIFKMPHTLDPDELAKNPQPAKFITVRDKYVLSDGDQSIELYRLLDNKYPDHHNSHAPDLLIAYLPKSKVLAEADFFNPGGPPPGPGAPIGTINLIGSKEVLRDNILRLKLDVQQFVPMHGNGVVPFADLQRGIEVEHALLDRYDRENKGAE
jgi:glyoxylase-like metal-dependent hydrolase (beta-lactamase superfamily II)